MLFSPHKLCCTIVIIVVAKNIYNAVMYNIIYEGGNIQHIPIVCPEECILVFFISKISNGMILLK